MGEEFCGLIPPCRSVFMEFSLHDQQHMIAYHSSSTSTTGRMNSRLENASSVIQGRQREKVQREDQTLVKWT